MTNDELAKVREKCEGAADFLFNSDCTHNLPGDLLPRACAADCCRCVAAALLHSHAEGMRMARKVVDDYFLDETSGDFHLIGAGRRIIETADALMCEPREEKDGN